MWRPGSEKQGEQTHVEDDKNRDRNTPASEMVAVVLLISCYISRDLPRHAARNVNVDPLLLQH